MKIFKSIAFIALLAISALSISCSDDNEERGYKEFTVTNYPALPMSGEWYITITDVHGVVQVENARHKTYDSNDGQLWISDHVGPQGRYNNGDFTGWLLDAKVNYNLADLTFSGANAANIGDGSIVNITEGKILKNAALSTGGNVTDSIYFKAAFDYEPENVLTFSGYRRTGFLEDEH